MMLNSEKSGRLIPDAAADLSKLMDVTFEEARSMKDSALLRGAIRRRKDEMTGKYFLQLTPKGSSEALSYQQLISQTSGAQKPGVAVVRRAASVKPLNSKEKEHFVTQFERLNDAQLAIYHLILANSLGVQNFNYLNFKFLNGVLKIEPAKIQQDLRELEDLGLIRLEGVDGNTIKPNHSYLLLSKLFPEYCKEKDSLLNNRLKDFYFAPHLVEEANLRSYKGRETMVTVSPKEVKTLKSSNTLEVEVPRPLTKSVTDSVLSAGELRHHTVQNHSSMPEIEQAYWEHRAVTPTYANGGLMSQGIHSVPMPAIQPMPNPYSAKRNPLTILIDGDQQSLRGFMKEAKLDRLRSGDSIYLFSASGAHSNLSLELVRQIEELKENVYFKRITSEIRRSNTMDHLIIARLTMLLTADFNRDFIILSEDKGFAGAITMLNDTYNLRRGQIQLQTIAIL